MRGVKGVDCQSLTEEINKALGEVYESKPTQEMFEQSIEVSVEAEATVSESWTGSSSVSHAHSHAVYGVCLPRPFPPLSCVCAPVSCCSGAIAATTTAVRAAGKVSM